MFSVLSKCAFGVRRSTIGTLSRRRITFDNKSTEGATGSKPSTPKMESARNTMLTPEEQALWDNIKKNKMFVYPAVFWAVIGSLWNGGNEFHKSIKSHDHECKSFHDGPIECVSKTIGGFASGAVLGLFLGAIWPITLPILVARDYLISK